MKVDEATLLQYVDGGLTADRRRKLEKRIAASLEIARSVTHLEVSRLPYREVFSYQKLPPLPRRLTQSVLQMATRHEALRRAAPHADDELRYAGRADHARAPYGTPTTHIPMRPLRRVAPGWLAASFVAGALCFGFGLQPIASRNAPAANATSVSEWLKAAVGYQQLYTRATLLDVPFDAGALARTVDTIHREDRLALQVPDLGDMGLSLRQIQRLRFHDKTLVQLAWLPEHGEPVALCIIRQAGPDQALARRTVDEMSVMTWRHDQVAYALIAPHDSVDLEALSKRIADRGTS
jgi:anti-sigma factor RsiW